MIIYMLYEKPSTQFNLFNWLINDNATTKSIVVIFLIVVAILYINWICTRFASCKLIISIKTGLIKNKTFDFIKKIFSVCDIKTKNHKHETITARAKMAEHITVELNGKESKALFLHAPWGSGKTRFYQNEIKPQITNNAVIYISGLDFKNYDEFRLGLILKYNPVLRLFKLSKIVSTIFDSAFNLLPKNRVI